VRTRLAVWADRDALMALVRAHRLEEAHAAGIQVDSYWEDAAGVVESHLTSSRRFYLIAEVDSVLVGFVRFSVQADQIEIGEVYVALPYRQSPIRGAMLERLNKGLHVE